MIAMVLQTGLPQAQYYSRTAARYVCKVVRTTHKNYQCVMDTKTFLPVYRIGQRDKRATTQIPTDHTELVRAQRIYYPHKT
jgi:hypothetical protein